MNLICLIGFLVTNLVIPNASQDSMTPRTPTSSQNSKANNDVPPPLKGLPPMNVERLYRYLENLAGLVKRQARAIETQALDNPHLLRVTHLMTLRSQVLLNFSGTSNPMEVEAWILKIEKFFDVIDCSEEQKTSYATFMLDKEADH